jgi:hypothetical protein
MTEEEHRTLAQGLEDPLMSIEAMERRLHMQSVESCFADASLCVWFVCTDVCPPGG